MPIDTTDEKQRLAALALETEARTLGRDEGNRVRKAITDALSSRSITRYNAPAFETVGDRDVFLARFRETFMEEFGRPLT